MEKKLRQVDGETCLIEAVQEREILWNVRRKECKDRHKRDQALVEVLQLMGCDDKWKATIFLKLLI